MKKLSLETKVQILTYCVGFLLLAALWSPATEVFSSAMDLRPFAPQDAVYEVKTEVFVWNIPFYQRRTLGPARPLE